MIDGRHEAPADGTRPVQARIGQRREIRLPMGVAGAMVSAGEPPACVRLADLSRAGARCFAPKPPPVGSAVELQLDGLRVAATICWTSGSMCGLRFDREIRAIDILVQSAKANPLPADAPDRSRIFLRGSTSGQATAR